MSKTPNLGMKKKLYIHIGSHKTATTYIQEIFAANRTMLEQADVLYPKAGEIYSAHHGLASALLSDADKYKDITEIPVWSELIQEIGASEASRVLLSSEDFEWDVDPNRLSVLKDQFDIHVIFYIRMPDAYLESYYNQLVKDKQTGEIRTIEEYVCEESLFFIDYLAIITKWANVFGVENCIVRIFEHAKKAGKMEEDILKLIGISDPLQFNPPPWSLTDQKISLLPDALEYIRLLNKFEGVKIQNKFRLIILLKKVCDENPDLLTRTRAGLLSIKAKKNILQRFSSSYKQLFKEYLHTDENIFHPDYAKEHPGFDDRLPEADFETVFSISALLLSTIDKKLGAVDMGALLKEKRNKTAETPISPKPSKYAFPLSDLVKKVFD